MRIDSLLALFSVFTFIIGLSHIVVRHDVYIETHLKLGNLDFLIFVEYFFLTFSEHEHVLVFDGSLF